MNVNMDTTKMVLSKNEINNKIILIVFIRNILDCSTFMVLGKGIL